MPRTEVISLTTGRQVSLHVAVDGTSGRTILFHPAVTDGFDPDPEATWARGVTLLGFGSGSGDVTRAADDLAEVLEHLGAGPVGVAGHGAAGAVVLALAARRADLVDRLVLLAVPVPGAVDGEPPTGDDDRGRLAQVSAKTLLLYGAKDPAAGPRHGRWLQQRLPDARYEQVPGTGPLAVAPMWRRALSHLAPRGRR